MDVRRTFIKLDRQSEGCQHTVAWDKLERRYRFPTPTHEEQGIQIGPSTTAYDTPTRPPRRGKGTGTYAG